MRQRLWEQSQHVKLKTLPCKYSNERSYLPLLPGQKPLHLLLGQRLGVGTISRVECCHPRVGQGLCTGHPPPEKHRGLLLVKWRFLLGKWQLFISCKFINWPGVLVEQGTDEILGLVRYFLKALLIKFPMGSCDRGQGLCIAGSLERRLTTQSENQRKALRLQHHYGCYNLQPTRWQ